MKGPIDNGVWDQQRCPAGKLGVGTKKLFKRKTDRHGKVEKYKRPLMAQRFWQVNGLHSRRTFSPKPAAARIRMVLATATVENREIRHLDVEQPFIRAGVDNENLY